MNYLKELLKLIKITKAYGPSHVLKMYDAGVYDLEEAGRELIEMHQNEDSDAWAGFDDACSFLKLTELEIENLSSDFNVHLNNHKGCFDEKKMAIRWVFDKTGRNGLTQCLNELEISREEMMGSFF